MASGRVCTFGFLVLIFSQVTSSTAADFDDSDGPVDPNSGDDYISTSSCSGISNSDLGDGCTISDDCSTITCNMDFVKKPITFKLKVNKCADPVSVTASMEVPDLDITWSHTYTSDEVIAVPGFTVSLPPLFSLGVYVQAGITDSESDNLHLKVNLLAGGSILSDESAYPVKFTVMEGDLPISTDDCGPFGWFIDLSTPAKIAVIVGPILFIIIAVSCCCCCCGCCGCCGCFKNRSSQHGTVVMATGAPGMGTSVKSNVKMRPLVEEI